MANDDKSKEKTDMKRARVARGRTVEVDGTAVGPGKLVSLPAAEVDTLIGKGFLVAEPVADIKEEVAVGGGGGGDPAAKTEKPDKPAA